MNLVDELLQEIRPIILKHELLESRTLLNECRSSHPEDIKVDDEVLKAIEVLGIYYYGSAWPSQTAIKYEDEDEDFEND